MLVKLLLLVEYVLAFILVSTIIWRTVINYRYKKLVKMTTNIFHYLELVMVASCKKNSNNLYVGELFTRFLTKNTDIVFGVEMMNIILAARYVLQETGSLRLDRLYNITAESYNLLMDSGEKVNDTYLLNKGFIHLDYDPDSRDVIIYSGKDKLSDLEYGEFSMITTKLYKYFKRLYDRCRMKKKFIGLFVVDYDLFNDEMGDNLETVIKERLKAMNKEGN